MDRIRLIASDMDATLLDGHSQLPPDFLHLVQELAGQDILFAAASGRPLYKLEEMFAPVLEQTLLVADNGGAVRWRGKDLFVSRMEPEIWHRLTACAEENGDSFVVCGLENAYLRPCDRCYDAVYRNFYNRIAYVSDLYTIDAAVDKFTIYLPQDNAQEVYEKVYGPRFGQELAVAVSGKCWIDVTNPGVTKGKAVERLSRLLDIPSGAMMAFGDTYNDIEMLEAVGYGFLMENGSPELRSRVPYLALPNTNTGWPGCCSRYCGKRAASARRILQKHTDPIGELLHGKSVRRLLFCAAYRPRAVHTLVPECATQKWCWGGRAICL